MNPQSDQTPGLRLPQPSFNLGQAPMAHAAEAFHPPESTSAPAEVLLAPASTPAPAMPTTPQPVQQTVMPALMPAPAQDVSTVSAQGDDENAVDQEWIAKAREIVARTHTDPYLQSSELSKIKAHYIKVRYGKDIKIDED
jgi:alpha-beta hydrolase superfamily lysophospholipase